ncbi:uncharacterized protein EI97DRAFT_445388 [Westerdykella ornata]|uniref:N-acetyltransferase domain-containing protein n=1 Tax=Westerdykella ornata TaxID=318751 RepID=A0A6A6JAE0_WESOR|nr:uncharacterized protein EI97DRAFT_445388 [Westerdykella ornata]KAF2272938.1 hypothetical protein EI97DRAFT_445388 [Westerdykella ornata]
MSRDPELPPFENIRAATLVDLPRIASVAAAGFFWSPTFQFQRPYHADFPEDTISSYWFEYHEEIVDPASIVLVAEDVFDPHEDESVYDALRKCSLHKQGKNEQVKVVVGVCSINLRPGSPFIGRLNEERAWRKHTTPRLLTSPDMLKAQMQSPAMPRKLSRDQSARAVKQYEDATGSAKKRHLAGLMRLSTLAVHPAYWRRGHATRLVSWCMRLADAEAAPIGISAAPMGASIAVQAGFEEREVVSFRGELPRSVLSVDVRLWIGVRPPSGSPSESSTVYSESSAPDIQPFGDIKHG